MSVQIDSVSLSFAQRLAHIKARQLRPLLPRETTDDLEQELLLEVIAGWERYDSTRAHEPFIERLVQQRAWKILRDRRFGSRSGEQAFHLGDHDRPAPTSDTDIVCMKDDVDAVVRKLPTPLREACDQLRHETVSAVARARGMPRSTLDSSLAKVRAAFKDAALDSYLP